MDQKEHETWIGTLKVGDQVCYRNRWSGYHIVEIIKITPTKQIKTSNGYTFKDGYHRIDSWERYALEPVTDEVRDHIRFKNLMSKVKSFDFSRCNLDQLEKVSGLINEVEGRYLPQAIVTTALLSAAEAEKDPNQVDLLDII